MNWIEVELEVPADRLGIPQKGPTLHINPNAFMAVRKTSTGGCSLINLLGAEIRTVHTREEFMKMAGGGFFDVGALKTVNEPEQPKLAPRRPMPEQK